MPTDSVTQALLEAADVLENSSGLYKGGGGSLSSTCAGLAISEVAPDSVRYSDGTSPSYTQFYRECGDRLGLPPAPDPELQFSRIVLWNDAPERTKDEVVAALREAARS